MSELAMKDAPPATSLRQRLLDTLQRDLWIIEPSVLRRARTSNREGRLELVAMWKEGLAVYTAPYGSRDQWRLTEAGERLKTPPRKNVRIARTSIRDERRLAAVSKLSPGMHPPILTAEQRFSRRRALLSTLAWGPLTLSELVEAMRGMSLHTIRSTFQSAIHDGLIQRPRRNYYALRVAGCNWVTRCCPEVLTVEPPMEWGDEPEHEEAA